MIGWQKQKGYLIQKAPDAYGTGGFFSFLPFFFHLPSSFFNLSRHYRPQQLVTPSVVAMAVRIEMAI